MTFARVPVLGIVLLTLLAGGATVHADPIVWNYNWSRSPDIIYSDNSATSYITLTDEQLHSVTGNSDIVATNLRTYSDALPETPAKFTAKSYTLSLFLQDQTTGNSGTLFFTGQFDGTLSKLSSNIANSFTGQTTQTLVLGNDLFTVKVGTYAPPGPTNSSNAGSISAFASVSVTTIIQDVPEPSTLLLALGALPLAAYGYWRRRNQLC